MKIRKIIFYIVFILFIIVFFITLKNIVFWLMDNNYTKKTITKINKQLKQKEIDDNVFYIDNSKEKKKIVDYDFQELKQINSDTVGYISVNGTNIKYPIVQTNNNDYYLYHSFDKTKNSAGWVFLDYRNKKEEFDNNNIIYAHGRLDNTMFGSLRWVIKDSWYSNKDNYYVNYSNDKYNSLWKVFSTYKIKNTDDYLEINFNNNDKYQKFLNMIKNRSIYNYNTDINVNDKIITLSSCYDDNNKVVLHAKLIKYSSK